MTDVPPPTIRLTDRAVAHLSGRPLVLRVAHRNGCCGGSAAVPIAEVGPPADLDLGVVVRVGEVDVHVDARLDPGDGWEVDVDGLWRWERLRAEPLRG
ncbi:MAG TPA: CC/Se motif family (seleno)protein [Acidimicrobiales bacterium]|nr:CC/Se motif family (seleno)protein [Acidimicrobiales bacterium]